MEQIFAPWRIEWVERDETGDDIEGCVFCGLPERDADREHRIVAKSERSYVLMNNYPYNPGHVMVIPRTHTGHYEDLDPEAMLDHARLKARTFEAMSETFEPDGFNAGLNLGGPAAGGSIDDHLHTHVVPRWNGDTNFMATIADTSVIVEAIAESYDRLHAAFTEQPGARDQGPDRAVRFEFD